MGGRFGGLVSDISDLDQIDGDIISKDFMVTLIANYLLSFLVVLYLSAHNSAIVFSLGTVFIDMFAAFVVGMPVFMVVMFGLAFVRALKRKSWGALFLFPFTLLPLLPLFDRRSPVGYWYLLIILVYVAEILYGSKHVFKMKYTPKVVVVTPSYERPKKQAKKKIPFTKRKK